MKLFDRDGRGAQEVTDALGLISNRIDFDMWRPILPLGLRDVVAIVGREPVDVLSEFYLAGCEPTDRCPAMAAEALCYLQQSVALFTWLKIIPTLDAQHDASGRSRRIGENETGLTALEQYKDEANILRMAYEAVDALIESLDRNGFEFWTSSPKYKLRAGLLVRSKEHFDEYYMIGSHRLFLTLLPMIREVQSSAVVPVVGRQLLDRMLSGDVDLKQISELAERAVCLLTMKKAVERLPVEVLPEGIVQVNQSTPVKQRLKAEKSARDAVVAALSADASYYLQLLEDAVAELNASGEPVDFYMPRPLIHSKGLSL